MYLSSGQCHYKIHERRCPETRYTNLKKDVQKLGLNKARPGDTADE
jgi:hypothetical protein